MYSVVGCSDCEALWVVADRPETTECPRCGTRHRFELLKQFVATEDEDHAREVRASMLAARAGQSESFAAVDSFADLEDVVDDAGMTDEAYLSGAGLDPDEVAAAGERAASGAGGSSSCEETVRAALREQEAPDESDVVSYCVERGVPAEAARDLLGKLRDAGEVVERDGALRAL